jgi:peroxiredoxin family protein
MASGVPRAEAGGAEAAGGTALTEEDVRRIVREEVAAALRQDPAARRACIIASKGTLDWAYPPFILASAAAAAGMEASVFFTFYGLNLLLRDLQRLAVSPVGNPALPMPLPLPDIVTALPGMRGMATGMMRALFREKGVATVRELRDICLESGVRLIACTMTMEVFGYRREDFVDGVELGGAGAFLSAARHSHVTLFV